jgi:hypothetical protein
MATTIEASEVAAAAAAAVASVADDGQMASTE